MSQKENYPSVVIDVEYVASDVESVSSDVESNAIDMESIGIPSSHAGGLICSKSFSVSCNINNNINYKQQIKNINSNENNNIFSNNIINNKEAYILCSNTINNKGRTHMEFSGCASTD